MRIPALLVAVILSSGVAITQAQSVSSLGADRHVAKGVTCEMCHGSNKEIATTTIEQCSKCHVPDSVSEKTKNVKPQNPHVSPHYGNTLDCALCHVQHAETENYCAQCHDFKYKVP